MVIFAPLLTYTPHFAEHLHVSVESSAYMPAAVVLPYSTQGKHPVHSMSSHCALHSSHLSVSSSKEVLPLPEDCRSGIVQSPLLGHLSFIFHRLLWAVASPGRILRYMLKETFICCKGFYTPQDQVQTNKAKGKSREEAAQ